MGTMKTTHSQRGPRAFLEASLPERVEGTSLKSQEASKDQATPIPSPPQAAEDHKAEIIGIGEVGRGQKAPGLRREVKIFLSAVEPPQAEPHLVFLFLFAAQPGLTRP